MIVERAPPRRTDHVVQLREAADRAGMTDRQMIALHEILGQNLPIGVPNMGLAKRFDIGLHLEIVDEVLDLGELRRNWRRLGIERHHRPAEPGLAADLRQLVILLAETDVARHRRRPAQRPVEIIAPAMIGADDRAAIAGALQERRHAMAAHVGHRPQFAVLAADDDNRFARQLIGQVVAGVRQRAGAPDADPLAGEDVFQLALEEPLARVNARRHGARGFERPIDIGDQLADRRVEGHGRSSISATFDLEFPADVHRGQSAFGFSRFTRP